MGRNGLGSTEVDYVAESEAYACSVQIHHFGSDVFFTEYDIKQAWLEGFSRGVQAVEEEE